uniref:Leucine rich repeats and immunoglobulin like domains 1 n=1 Tax=Leptobrachium leishanense TaxID=445787 RepID=A0A8C5RAB9_9ANUR
MQLPHRRRFSLLALLPYSLCFHLLVGSCLGSSAPCPSSCTCSGDLVDCSYQGLSQIPPDLPPWTVQLNLSYNKLNEIDPAAFAELLKLQEVLVNHNELTAIPSLGDASSRLISLSLHHNKIRSIEASRMKRYVALETLDLSFNEIAEVRSGCFPPGLQIKELNLGSNKLSSLEPEAFETLGRSLLTLRLSKNRIIYLPARAFKLPRLTQLELNRNRIRSIEGLTFQGLDSLEVLKLQRNNISKLADGAFWGLSRIQILHLEYNNLKEVNSGSLYGLHSLQQLHLSYNSISQISSGGWSFCQNLQELVLSHNNLTRLDEGILVDLGALEILLLGHNSISHIAEGFFKGLKSLRILELDHNEISGTIEDTNGAFIGLESLSKLTLFRNKIKSVAKKAFSGLGALEHLNLGENAIRSVQPEAFGEMKSLKELILSSDSLLCDCHLKWLPPWLTGRRLQAKVTATCAHPESIKNKSIFDVTLRSFVCDDFPKPQINVQPENTMAVFGKDVRFTCTATSSSSSPMTFYWMKNSEILHNAETENFAKAREMDRDVIDYTTILHLRNVTFSLDGRYQCVISNNFGSTYSNKARLTVNILPSFIKTPRDITMRTGTKARLECAAEGFPIPEIAWQKDGGTDFPAARERRMHVMPDDDVFFIMEVKSEDMGVYSCTAQNSAGSVSANATLTVLEMPFLTHPIEEDRVVSLGATLALQCKANGSPLPRITWLKGDEPLVITDRHHFTPGNQLLVIRNVILEDAGKYTCEMSNTLGTERAYSRVTVLPTTGCMAEQGKKEGTMTFGIVTIAVVCSIVLTSLVWVCIIYQTRKKREEYSVTNTDETIVPPDVPSYLSSQGIYSSDGGGNLDVEACNVTYRQPRLCIGCNSEGCKTTDGIYPDHTGYGYQITCTDCLDDHSLYDKNTDYCQQALRTIEYPYHMPLRGHDMYGDCNTSCHQIAGTFDNHKVGATSPPRQCNSESVTASCALDPNVEGPCKAPLLRSTNIEGFHEENSVSEGCVQQMSDRVSEPETEDTAKQRLQPNGHVTCTNETYQNPNRHADTSELLSVN